MAAAPDETRGILEAWRLVMDASWPGLAPAMSARAAQWGRTGAAELQSELRQYMAETEANSRVRVFWKLGDDFRFGGCNGHFAKDAGLEPAQIAGIDDFDKRLPWMAQAAKYRADDEEVYKSGHPKLDILERQKSAAGITWVLAGKAPIRAGGRVIGILGMYEVLEGEAARVLLAKRAQRKAPGT